MYSPKRQLRQLISENYYPGGGTKSALSRITSPSYSPLICLWIQPLRKWHMWRRETVSMLDCEEHGKVIWLMEMGYHILCCVSLVHSTVKISRSVHMWKDIGLIFWMSIQPGGLNKPAPNLNYSQLTVCRDGWTLCNADIDFLKRQFWCSIWVKVLSYIKFTRCTAAKNDTISCRRHSVFLYKL